MTIPYLRFQSPEKIYGLPPDSAPHSATVGKWLVSELYEPNTHGYLGDGVGTYRLQLEREVTARDEVWDALREASSLAEQLDRAWCYVCGAPLLAVPSGLTPLETPHGWTGNLRDVDVAIRKEHGAGVLCEADHVVTKLWMQLAFRPLERALVFRNAYIEAQPAVQDLIWLHAQSYKSGAGQLYCLTKALELARAFFPGPTSSDRTEQMQQEMKTISVEPRLRQSVNWLFEMASNRLDIRHVVVPGSGAVTAHPKLTDAEQRDFVADADLVIRAFVCSRLDVDIILVG